MHTDDQLTSGLTSGQASDVAVPSITTAVDTANFYRTRIKVVAGGVRHAIDTLREGGLPASAPGADVGEIIANFTLAYRHLEDASQRLGKAIQAADGGISVYDKATTVGAPE